MPEPKILFFDIENSPSLGYYYDRWKEGNIIKDREGWFMLSFAYKWQGENEIHVRALPDYPGYRRNKKCDKALLKDLASILDEADITVAHNGDRHDIKKTNARLAYHDISPPSPYKSIDTFKAAKRYFSFTANNLDHLSEHFGIGRKLPTTGFEMHERCMEGDMTAWPVMRDYNKHDIFLLEGCYLRLRPFMANHPQLTHYTKADACPSCQSSSLQCRGFNFTKTGKRQRMQCTDCGAWSATGDLIKAA